MIDQIFQLTEYPAGLIISNLFIQDIVYGILIGFLVALGLVVLKGRTSNRKK